MTAEDIKSSKSKRNELRKFGVTIAIALSVIGVLIFWRQKDYYKYFFIISVLFLFPALFMPTILRPVHKSWMMLSVKIGWFMNRVILIALYYLILTPIGLVMRILGKNFLNAEFTRDSSESYWIPKDSERTEKRDYERQF